jgi:hypothetical protein
MAVDSMTQALFFLFIAFAVAFSLFLLYFVKVVGKKSKGFIRSKIFLNTDPIIKAFYQFFIGAAFAYMLFIAYFVDPGRMEWFILGETMLGLSLIGFAYLIIPMFQKKQ